MFDDIVHNNLFKDKILQIEFKNIKKNNALSLNMLDKLHKILSDKRHLKKFSCIVFKGYQEGPFSSGADLNDLALTMKNNKLKIYHHKFNKILRVLVSIKVPKICLIRSFCLGAGLIFALHTDIILAEEETVFAIPASKLGIKLPTEQINSIYKKFSNKPFFLDVMISGRKFTAEEAYNSNLVSQLISKNNFQASCLSYLKKILNNSNPTIKYYLSKTV